MKRIGLTFAGIMLAGGIFAGTAAPIFANPHCVGNSDNAKLGTGDGGVDKHSFVPCAK
jgi:hypothetical protein